MLQNFTYKETIINRWYNLRKNNILLYTIKNLILQNYYKILTHVSKDKHHWKNYKKCEQLGSQNDTFKIQTIRLYNYLIQRIGWIDKQLFYNDTKFKFLTLFNKNTYINPITESPGCRPWDGIF